MPASRASDRAGERTAMPTCRKNRRVCVPQTHVVCLGGMFPFPRCQNLCARCSECSSACASADGIRLAYRRCDHGNEENAMSRHDGSKAAQFSRRSVLKGAAALGGAAIGSGVGGFPDGLGAKYQGRRAAPRRRAGDGDSANCGASDEGPGLHRTDAGVRASRSPESLPVAIQRDRLRRRQLRLHALPGRPRCAAGDSTCQGQALGQDAAAVHQG